MTRKCAVLFEFVASCVFAAGLVVDAHAAMDRTRFRIGTYSIHADCRTEANLRDMKACGIDFVIDNFKRDARSAALLKELGIGIVEQGVVPSFWGGDKSINGKIAQRAPLPRYEAALRAYQPTVADEMIDIGDENSALDFPHFGQVVTLMRKRAPNLTPYVNLHPAIHRWGYVNLYYGVTNYIEYIARYVRDVPLDYISYDLYPYQFTDRPAWGVARFFDNMRIVADACRDSDRSFWYIAQVNTQKMETEITENKLRYQAYSAMAFGVESLTWACWMKGWWTNNVLRADGTRTVQYGRLKRVNAEIKSFCDAYMRYRRVETYFTGFTGEAAAWLARDPQTYLPVVNTNAANGIVEGRFKGVRALDGLPLLLGVFKARDAKDASQALFVFAADDPWDQNPRTRQILLPPSLKLALRGGSPSAKIEVLNDGRRILSLRSSHGALLTVN